MNLAFYEKDECRVAGDSQLGRELATNTHSVIVRKKQRSTNVQGNKAGVSEIKRDRLKAIPPFRGTMHENQALSFTEFLINRSPICVGEVEAIEVHDFGPCRNEVMHKLLLAVLACIDFRDRSQLRV